jgi:glycosyltransferase involved in cell wall biosynthesis
MPKIVFCYTIPLTYCFSIETISLLRDKGYGVTLISSHKNELIEVAEKLNVDFRHIELSRDYNFIKDISALIKLFFFLRDLKPDIVVGATPKAALISMIAGSLARIKHRIYHIFGLPYETAYGIKRKILTSFERITSLFASEIIPISYSINEVYVAKFPSLKNKIRIIGSLTVGGVDTTRFNIENLNVKSEIVKAELGIPNDNLVIGFVARLTKDKGVGDFIEMWNIIKTEREKTVVLIIGTSDERDNFDEQKLQDFIDETRVFHIKSSSEIEKYFSIMDIFVLPSHREGFGNVIAEASSMKIPVVTYNVTGCKDSVLSGYSGILVENGDISSLAMEVITLIDSSEKRQKLGINGRKFIKENFARNIVANNFTNYCQSII